MRPSRIFDSGLSRPLRRDTPAPLPPREEPCTVSASPPFTRPWVHPSSRPGLAEAGGSRTSRPEPPAVCDSLPQLSPDRTPEAASRLRLTLRPSYSLHHVPPSGPCRPRTSLGLILSHVPHSHPVGRPGRCPFMPPNEPPRLPRLCRTPPCQPQASTFPRPLPGPPASFHPDLGLQRREPAKPLRAVASHSVALPGRRGPALFLQLAKHVSSRALPPFPAASVSWSPQLGSLPPLPRSAQILRVPFPFHSEIAACPAPPHPAHPQLHLPPEH